MKQEDEKKNLTLCIHNKQTNKQTFVYYEWIKRDLKRRHICGCLWNVRLEDKTWDLHVSHSPG